MVHSDPIAKSQFFLKINEATQMVKPGQVLNKMTLNNISNIQNPPIYNNKAFIRSQKSLNVQIIKPLE